MGYAREEDGELKLAYRPSGRPLELADLEAHISGNGPVVGIYVLNEESQCHFAAFDVDAQDLPLIERLRQAAMDLGFPADAMMVVDSGKKGFHLHLLFAEWTPGELARRLLMAILRKAEVPAPSVEMFPKQARLTEHQPYGSLIKLPLAIHPLSGRRAAILNPRRVTPAPASTIEAVAGVLEAPRATEGMEGAGISLPTPSGRHEEPHLSVLNGGVQEGSRDNRLTQEAGRLRALGLGYEEILPILRAFNQNACVPPLSERVVEEKARGILRYPAGEGETGLRRPGPIPDEEIGTIAATAKTVAIDWLWQGRLPLGMLVMLDGDPELGKSTLSYDWAARITTGRDWPDKFPSVEGGVVVIAGEDSLANVIGPRLQAAGADLNRVLVISNVPNKDGSKRLPSLPEDVELLGRQIRRMNARLLIFDPIMPYMSAALNANKDGDVRKALTPLAEVLERENCTGLLLRHLNKDSKTENALYRGLHSIAFIALARAGMAVAKDPDQRDHMILAMTKSNLGPKPANLRYTIEEVNLGQDARGKDIMTSRIGWRGESSHSANTLITAFGKDAPRQGAAELLADMIIRPNTEVPVDEIRAAAASAGIAWITLRRAADELGIRARKTGFGPDGCWLWGPNPAYDAHRVSALGTNVRGLRSSVSQSDHLKSILGEEVSALGEEKGEATNGSPYDAHFGETEEKRSNGSLLEIMEGLQ